MLEITTLQAEMQLSIKLPFTDMQGFTAETEEDYLVLKLMFVALSSLILRQIHPSCVCYCFVCCTFFLLHSLMATFAKIKQIKQR